MLDRCDLLMGGWKSVLLSAVMCVGSSWAQDAPDAPVAAEIKYPPGTLIEAENPPPRSAVKVVEDADASGGRAISAAKAWEPVFSTDALPEGDPLRVHVRYRGGPFIAKGQKPGQKQQDLKAVYGSPEAWKWVDLGSYSREQIGGKLVIIRTNKGDLALDCVVIQGVGVEEPQTLPPFEPDASAAPVPVGITIDWQSEGTPMPAALWGVGDYGILKPGDRGNAGFQAYLSRLDPPMIRIHWARFSEAWTDAERRGWDVEQIKQAFAEVAEAYGDAPIMMNIPQWPKWFHEGSTLPPEKHEAFARLCADLVRVMREDVGRRVEYWEVLNELEGRYDKAGQQPEHWALLGKVMRAMREADPSAKFGGPALTWAKPEWVRGYMEALGDQTDFVTWHAYATDDIYMSNEALFEKADAIAEQSQQAVELVRKLGRGRAIETFLTEYNVSWTWRAQDRRMTNNIGAIFHARVVGALSQTGIDGAMVWHIKDGVYGLLDAQGVARPPSELFVWGSRFLHGRRVPAEVLRTEPDADAEAEPLEALAVRREDGGRALLLINRSPVAREVADLSALGVGESAVLRRIDAEGIHPASDAPTGGSLRVPGFSLMLLSHGDSDLPATTMPTPSAHRPVQLSDHQALERLRENDSIGSSHPLADRLLAEADRALQSPLRSVMDKRATPPSGDKHDYMSIGIYWWPDPTKADGLPWVRRDGQVNPAAFEGEVSDAGRLEAMLDDVQTLAGAYAVTGREDYAEHAAAMLRAWFLDPATRMNPHLRFAQGVPGREHGRNYGIITGFRFVPLIDALGVLSHSQAWTSEDQQALRGWFADYLQWLGTHEYGKSIAKARNNQGTWYEAQVLWVQAYVDPSALQPEELRAGFQRRIDTFAQDGSQPEELSRTQSLTYSFMNLYALSTIARLGDAYGLDLWHEDPRLRKALELLTPHVADASGWRHQQIEPLKAIVARPPLLLAAEALGNPSYRDVAEALLPTLESVTLLDLAGISPTPD